MTKSAIEYLENTTKKFPNKVALVDSDSTLSFLELRAYALNLALKIIELDSSYKNSPIFVYVPKSNKTIIAFMAALYSGNFYTPSDIDFPFEKVASVLDTLKPKVFIADTKSRQKLIENGVNVEWILNIDEILGGGVIAREQSNRSNLKIESTLDSEIASATKSSRNDDSATHEKIPPLPPKIKAIQDKMLDTDIIYTLFTSGSTGTPKGVAIAHKSVINYIDWFIDTFDIKDSEIIGNQAPFYFDNSTLDIYLCVATGATLHIIKKSHFAFPAKLIEYINTNGINMIFWVPSALSSVANADILSRINAKSLNKIIFAGEVMPTKILNYWQKYLPNAIYANLYGPTETTVDCTFYIVDRKFSDTQSLPIGKACRNYEILLFNEDNELISSPNELGELCVRGTGLAAGYYGDFEKSSIAFIQNPLNKNYEEKIYRTGDLAYYNEFGELMYAGRKDAQIKHLGYRIELGEIESAAYGLDYIRTAAAVYDEVGKKIVLFVKLDSVIASGAIAERSNLTESSIIKNLSQKLAQYMLPSVVIELENFPLNDNGKINKKELKMMYEGMIQAQFKQTSKGAKQ